MRAVSTVVDVSVFLLLVSVAVVTLSVPASDVPDSTADETAAVLATATTNVSYSVSNPDTGATGYRRTAAGTHAALLARAAVSNVQLSGHPLAPTTAPFRRAVRKSTEHALAWAPERTGVVAVWEPYPGAPLRGRVAAGVQPPAGADVATARLVVPASISPAGPAARNVASDGYRAVAETVVDATIGTTLATADGDAAANGPIARSRVRAYANALDLSRLRGGGDDFGEEALARIRRELTDVVAADMRERYDSPAAAAEDVRTGTITIVVREWSP